MTTSATGIVALGNEPLSILGAVAALMATFATVATSPAAGIGPAAKAAAKTVTKANNAQQTVQRQAMCDNLDLYALHLGKCTAESPPTTLLLSRIAAGKQRLADHDKQHTKDKSLKDLVSLTTTFDKLHDELASIEKRIISGVVQLAHEVATRELQLEQLVVECNRKKEERRVARSRCREHVYSKEHLKIIDSNPPKSSEKQPDDEGAWQDPKRPAKARTPSSPAPVVLSQEFHAFHPTDDDSPMDSPVETSYIDHCKKWYDRYAKTMADGQ